MTDKDLLRVLPDDDYFYKVVQISWMQTDSENKHGFEDICRSTYIEIDIF